MKAVILAAGIASRLRPLTNDTPKCLLNVGEKNILERTIDNIIKNGINDFIIVTGYLQHKIKNFISARYPHINVEYLYNEKYETTNNIYSLWMTKGKMNGENMLLLDSDILFDSRVIKVLLDSEHQNCLAVKSGFELSEEEIKVTLKEDSSINEISKVVDPKSAIGESIGIEKFNSVFVKQLFDILDDMILNKGDVDIFYEAAFQRAIDEGGKIFAEDVGELRCMELDFIEDLEKAKNSVVDHLQ